MRTFFLYRQATSEMCDALQMVGRLAQPMLWTANPDVRAGDRCLIYAVSPRCAVVAMGYVISDPFRVTTGEWKNQICVQVRLVADTSVPLDAMRAGCKWRALKGNALRATRFGPHGQGYANSRRVPEPHDAVLWRLADDAATFRLDS